MYIVSRKRKDFLLFISPGIRMNKRKKYNKNNGLQNEIKAEFNIQLTITLDEKNTYICTYFFNLRQ